MIRSLILNLHSIIMAIALTVVVSALVLSYDVRSAISSPSDNVSGYAWSDNIGWISFNGNNFGVNVSADGSLSGYAWSDNIGWISFNASDVVGCPSGSCAPEIDAPNDRLVGWARALSGGTAESGGWDGFISLSGTGYGVTINDKTGGCSWDGYAWGSDVVGWIQFSNVDATDDACGNPSAQIQATYCLIPAGSTGCTTQVTWSSNNFSGTPAVLQGTVQFSSSPEQLTPGVSRTINPGDNIFTIKDTASSFSTSINALASCAGAAIWTTASCELMPGISLTANPITVRSSNSTSVEVTILANYDLQCSISGGMNKTFNHSASPNSQTYKFTTNPLYSSTQVQVECVSPTFPILSGSDSLRINVIPRVEEI